MAFVPTYTDADVSSVAIDGIVKFLAVFGSLATLIALVVIWQLVRRQMR